MAAEVGHIELAYDYLGEAALIDLDDLEHNTRDGLHIASLAGSAIAVIAGLGGVRVFGGMLRCAPRLPQAITRLTFRISFQGRRLLVELQSHMATYSLMEGDALEIVHHGETVKLDPAKPAAHPIPRPPRVSPRPSRPAELPPAAGRRGSEVGSPGR